MATTNDLLMRLLFQDKASAGLKQAQRNAKDFGDTITSVNKVLGVFGVTLGGYALVQGAWNIAQLGAQADTVSASFDNLARSTNIASAAMIQSLRSVSRGAISDMELMQAANKAMLMGGQQMGQALPQLLELARAAAIATGEDMQFMFNSIVTGIARQSPLILDNLGLIVDMPTAYKAYAASIGVTVTALTEQQKMTALLNDVLRVAPSYIEKVGATATTSAEQVASLSASWANLKAQLGQALTDAGGGEAIGGIAKLIERGNQMKQTTGQIEDMIARLRELGQLDEARKLEEQFYKITKATTVSNAAIQRKADSLDKLAASAATVVDKEEELALRQNIAWVLADKAAYSTELYADALQKLATNAGNAAWALRLTAQAQSLATPAVMGSPIPSYISDINKQVGLYSFYGGMFDTQQARTKGAAAGSAAGEGWKRGFSDALSTAQSALTARMSPTGGDFLSTALGTYQNAPLESVRRLDAIIARGFGELKAHPDWAGLLKIPDDVLNGSELALKAWASQTRDAAANLARPDLIDWDAFLSEFQRLQQEQTGKQMVMDIAMGKVKQAGLMGDDAQTKQMLLQMFGLDTPETQALAIGEALNRAFSASDPAGIYLETFKTGTDQNKDKSDFIAKKLSQQIQPDGKAAAEKYIKDFAATIAGAGAIGAVAPSGQPVGGGYVLP